MNRFSGLKVRTNELVDMLWSFYSLFRDFLGFDVISEINKPRMRGPPLCVSVSGVGKKNLWEKIFAKISRENS